MTRVVKFDYRGLDAESRVVVEQKTAEIRDRIGRAAQNIFEVGERLIAVKDRIEHGQFSAWLKSEFDWSEWTARKMMAVASQFKTVNFTDLTIAPSALYLLASDETPAEIRAEVVERAKGGEKITHAKVKAVVPKKDKPAPAKPAVTKAAETSTEPAAVQVFFDEPVKPKPAPEAKPTPAPKAPATKDEAGNAVHRVELADLFGRRDELNELLRAVSAIKSKVLGGLKDGDELYRFINQTSFQSQVENLYRTIKFGLPHALCPYHADDALSRRGCKCCGGSGWVPKDVYEQAPVSMRKVVRK